ncbi:hypothetical protein A6R68_21243, partial [Neotoma lepida]
SVTLSPGGGKASYPTLPRRRPRLPPPSRDPGPIWALARPGRGCGQSCVQRLTRRRDGDHVELDYPLGAAPRGRAGLDLEPGSHLERCALPGSGPSLLKPGSQLYLHKERRSSPNPKFPRRQKSRWKGAERSAHWELAAAARDPLGGRPGQTGRGNPRPQLWSSGPRCVGRAHGPGRMGTALCGPCVGRRAALRTVARGGRARGTGPVSWAACRSAAEALPKLAEGNPESGWVAPRGQGCVDAGSRDCARAAG